MDMVSTFEIQQVSLTNKHVRSGILHTSSGIIKTPAVIPYAKNGLVSPLTSEELREIGCQSLAVNILPLSIQPGTQALESCDSVGSFLNWAGPVVSFVDQFSSLEKVKKNAGELGVRYEEPYSGAHKRITGKQAQQLQEIGQADIQLPLFQNADYYAPVDDLKTALKINIQWQQQGESSWGVIGGAGLKELRKLNYQQIGSKDGYLITNLPDEQIEWQRIVHETIEILPNDKPRMLVATSNEQIKLALLAGVDIIVTSIPIEMAHQGQTYINNQIEKVSYEQYENSQDKINITAQNEVNLSYLHYLSHIHSSVGDHLLGLRNWRWLNSYFNKVRSEISIMS